MSDTSLERIGQIGIRVHDVERAAAFYRDRLGLRHLFTASGMAFFECGGVRLLLGPPEGPGLEGPASILYFQVGDIGGACEALRSRGVRIEQEPHRVASLERHDVWIAHFRDSEDNLHALLSEVPRE